MKKTILLALFSILLTACTNQSNQTYDNQPELSAEQPTIIEPNVETTQTSQVATNQLTRFSHSTVGILDTLITTIAYTETSDQFEVYSQAITNEFVRLHNLFTTFHPVEGVNNLYLVNMMAGIEPVVVDPLIIDLLEYSKQMYEQTNGTLNIALGSVLQIWHNHRLMDNPTVPSQQSLTAANAHTDINNIIIDREQSTVFLQNPNTQIDVGTIAKGFSIDIVAEMAYDMGLRHFLINVGGDSRSFSGPPATGTWGAGVQNPQNPNDLNSLIDVVRLSNISIASSGNYQRYFMANNIRYHHIIDPSTLFPSTHVTATTVLHDNMLTAQILSTSLMIKTLEQGMELLEQLGGHALWILSDGSVIVSDGYRHFSDNF
jgi:thiamine biosynthesis lipoprotein